MDSFAAALSRQSLFRSYGRFFAEFLSDGSLVGLGLLDPSTGVGLRYGRQQHKLVSFSSQGLPQNRLFPKKRTFTRLEFPQALDGYIPRIRFGMFPVNC